MPSVFVPGASGSLVSTNRPAAFLEMAHLLQENEVAVPSDIRPNNVTIAIDLEGRTATITSSLPVEPTLGTDGQIRISASDYFAPLGVTSTFTNGGGDLRSSTTPTAFLELAQILNDSEQLIPAEVRPNNITISIDLDGRTAAIAATLPVTSVRNASGQVVVSAVDYL